MKSEKEGKNNKHDEQSTVSTEEERVNDSFIRMINSEHLTLEMAVNYLFQWRRHSKISGLLLERIQQFCLKKSVHFIPSIIFIMSLQYHDQFFKFCESLAHTSLPLYLIVRWSYSAYSCEKKSSQSLRNKLDSSLIGKFRYRNEQNFDEEEFTRNLKQKQSYSNYLSVLNDYFERLFRIPEKLKKYQKPNRNDKLRQYLKKITNTCLKDQNGYLNGIAFPIDQSSPIAVRVLTQHCFTFSTKERVPFKIVIQTLSHEDALKCKVGVYPKKQFKEQTIQDPKSDEREGEEKSNEEKPGLETNEEQKLNGEKQKKVLILPKTYFGQLWGDVQEKIKQESPYSSIPSYRIRSYMIKSGDDLRQEYMAIQLIKLIEEITIKENLTIWIRSYSVIPFNGDSGLIEFVPDTRTVSYLKEKSQEKSLRKIYQQMFGINWEESITNFIKSLAGYSLIQYIFQIKDRHNNNILIDTEGHMIHIDFSFILSSSPGNMNFQRAPFKLTSDYIELMEGKDSDIFAHFRLLFFLGLKFLRKYKKEIMETVVMMSHCQMKCFEKFDKEAMERRFHDSATDEQLQVIVDKIMDDAYSSYTTSSYDKYQWYTNLIYS